MNKQDRVCKKCKQSFKWGYDIEDYNSIGTYGECKMCYIPEFKEEPDLLDEMLKITIRTEN